MTTDNACETPMADHIADAVELMQRGARMRLDAIPGDSSMSSSMFGPDVTAEIAKRLTAPEAKSEVAVKPLEWRKLYPDNTMYPMDWHGKEAFDILYAVIQYSKDGQYYALGKGHETLEAAFATAQADYEARVRSALVDPEGGV